MNTPSIHLMLLILLLAVVALFCTLVGTAVGLLASTEPPTPAPCYGAPWSSRVVPPSLALLTFVLATL